MEIEHRTLHIGHRKSKLVKVEKQCGNSPIFDLIWFDWFLGFCKWMLVGHMKIENHLKSSQFAIHWLWSFCFATKSHLIERKKTTRSNVHNILKLTYGWTERNVRHVWVSFVLFRISTCSECLFTHFAYDPSNECDTPNVYICIQRMTTNIVPSFMNVDMGINVRTRK